MLPFVVPRIQLKHKVPSMKMTLKFNCDLFDIVSKARYTELIGWHCLGAES